MKLTNTANEKIANKTAAILFDVGCVIFRPMQPFKYSSGILSPVYTDNRLIISNPKARDQIVNFLIAKIKEIGIPDVIAGVATAGIPHAAFIAQKLNLPMVYVRSEPKSHGKGNQVEGMVKRGQKVIVVEDLISTGGSSLNVVSALRKLGAKVTDEIAIFSYGLEDSKKGFKASKVNLHPLTTLEHAAKVASQKGFLKQEHVEIVIDWARDPHNWAKSQGLFPSASS